MIDEANEDSESATFCITDRRLICVTNTTFKEIGYSHISSIEAESDTDTDYKGKSYLMPLVIGIVLVVGGLMLSNTGAVVIFRGYIPD